MIVKFVVFFVALRTYLHISSCHEYNAHFRRFDKSDFKLQIGFANNVLFRE